jgi:malonyl-CoA O-methyltransferase
MTRPALVLIGGWGAKACVWSPLVEELSEHDNIRCLELRDCPSDSADALCDYLVESIPDHSHVVGWSLGAMLATRIACKYPQKVSALVSIASNACFVRRDDWPNAMAIDVFKQFRSAFADSPKASARRFAALQAQGHAERKKVSAHLLSGGLLDEAEPAEQLALLDILHEIDLREDLAGLAQPCLHILGDSDALVPVSCHEDLAGLNKYLEQQVIEGCGHAPHLSHALTLAKTIMSFLAQGASKYSLDKRRISESFDRAAASYDDHSDLQRVVAKRLCQWPTSIEGRVLDLGCGTGYIAENLAPIECVGLDIAPSMLFKASDKLGPQQLICADMESLPLTYAGFDVVISSLAVQWCSSLELCFEEIARVLKAGGQWVFSSLGPNTLTELEQAWSDSGDEHVHVNRFHSAEQVMLAAEHSGFELQLSAREEQTREYPDLRALMRDLKGIGAHNLNGGSNKGLTGKQAFAKLEASYERSRNPRGFLPASYDVHYWVYEKQS